MTDRFQPPTPPACEHLEMRDLNNVSVCACGYRLDHPSIRESIAAARASLKEKP